MQGPGTMPSASPSLGGQGAGGPAVMTSAESATPESPAPMPSAAQPDAATGSGTTQEPAPAQAVAAQAVPAAGAPRILFQEPPTRVRVAVLNATGKPGGANKVALMLGEYRRRNLEDRIGLRLEMVNVSKADIASVGGTVIYYRAEFLRAALIMAEEIPGDQVVAPMRPADLKRAGVDVEIVVGAEMP